MVWSRLGALNLRLLWPNFLSSRGGPTISSSTLFVIVDIAAHLASVSSLSKFWLMASLTNALLGLKFGEVRQSSLFSTFDQGLMNLPVLLRFSKNFFYLSGRLLRCHFGNQHEMAFGPQHVFDRNSRWELKSVFEGQYQKSFEVFYTAKKTLFSMVAHTPVTTSVLRVQKDLRCPLKGGKFIHAWAFHFNVFCSILMPSLKLLYKSLQNIDSATNSCWKNSPNSYILTKFWKLKSWVYSVLVSITCTEL